MSEVNEKTPLLEVRNLRKLFAGKSSFFQKDKSWIKAVDDVSFTLNPKETLGVVGESGCGKSTMGRSVLRLIEPTSGEIFYKGKDFTKASGQELRKMRADMQIIFQDPYASLNPRMTIVFGMGTGVSPKRIGTRNFGTFLSKIQQCLKPLLIYSLERR